MKSGRELESESIGTVLVTGGNQATTCSKLSSVRWQTEILANQEKAGVTPHTLHERRPLTKNDTQQSSPTDYTQRTKQQRKNLNGRFQETEQREAIDWQDILTPVSQNSLFFCFPRRQNPRKSKRAERTAEKSAVKRRRPMPGGKHHPGRTSH